MTDEALFLRTTTLVLSPAAPADAPELFPFTSDPAITAYLAWAPHASVDETAAMLRALRDAQARDAGYHWTIRCAGAACGLISLIDVRRTHRTWTLQRAEIAYWVGVPWQGRGIATEATTAVVAAAFERLGLHRLVISHTSANPASGHIPQKLGFRYVGYEDSFFQKDGVWHDMHHYELIASRSDATVR